MEISAELEKAIGDRVAHYMTNLAGLTAAATAPALTPITKPEDGIAALKNALTTEGVTFIIRQPEQAHGAFMQLVSLVEDLFARVKGLERQNAEFQMLISELKKRAVAPKDAPKPPKPAKKKGR